MPENMPGTEKKPKSSPVINEVKYSLPELLAEVEEERQNSILARELVDQAEIQAEMIGILKKNRRRSRGNNSRG